MTARPTPETDREDIIITKGKPTHWVSQEFARKLEHERDEAKFDLDFRRRLGDFQNKTIDDLRAQLDDAREYADKLAEGLPDGMLPKDVEVLRSANTGLAAELTAVTAQRDEAREQHQILYEQTGNTIYEARKQRDRLAEALRNIVSIYEHPDKWCIPSSSDMYDEAIRSLTPNSQNH